LKYKHLTIEERYHIQAFKKAGYKNNKIAKDLGVSDSTVSRELKRNSSTQRKSYSAISANNISNDRRTYASRKSNKKMYVNLKNIIKKYIIEDWSPEQISKRLKEVDITDISYVSIYQFVEQDKQQGGNLYTHLRFYHTGHRRAKYGSKNKGRIKDRTSISKRDKIVDEKSRVGDWEIDTIVGAGKKGAITTVVERVTSLVRISIPTTKKAIDIENETIRILKPLRDKIYTITSDNGLEFANHQNISKALDYNHYFCHPYSSWERGLNECTNGLIRQYIPKGTSFKDITPEYIKMIEDKLNNRPRKALNWKTPNEVFYGLKAAA
jgi:IS30 family transposase